jgi:hypothetical protein
MTPWMRPLTERRVHRTWIAAGRPAPAPPIVKQRIVRTCLQKYGLDTLVETGTYTGDMVDALVGHAQRIISIELDEQLYLAARQRFAGESRVELLLGDSAALLPRVLKNINGRALFWLDGHYTAGVSGPPADSPIVLEIEALLAEPPRGNVVLIDDARLFTGSDGYPTVDALRTLILNRRPDAHVSVSDDIVSWVDARPEGPGTGCMTDHA